MGILETRHGIITESVHLIFVTFLTESSKEKERRFFTVAVFFIYFVPWTVPHVSVVSVAECPVYN